MANYRRDGFHFPVSVLSTAEARSYRDRLEANERTLGGPLSGNMRQKPHLLFTWANELARHPKILDAVEDVIGPDILCWSTTFFTKEAHSPSFVSWHQDATYWGLSTNDVITAWVAFADAPVSGMKFAGEPSQEPARARDNFAATHCLPWPSFAGACPPKVSTCRSSVEMSLHHLLLRTARGPTPPTGASLRHPLHPPQSPDQGAGLSDEVRATTATHATSTRAQARPREPHWLPPVGRRTPAKVLYDGTQSSFRA